MDPNPLKCDFVLFWPSSSHRTKFSVAFSTGIPIGILQHEFLWPYLLKYKDELMAAEFCIFFSFSSNKFQKSPHLFNYFYFIRNFRVSAINLAIFIFSVGPIYQSTWKPKHTRTIHVFLRKVHLLSTKWWRKVLTRFEPRFSRRRSCKGLIPATLL